MLDFGFFETFETVLLCSLDVSLGPLPRLCLLCKSEEVGGVIFSFLSLFFPPVGGMKLMGDILFNYGPGAQYPRVSGASSLFTGNLAYSMWRGAQGEGEVEDQSRGHRVRG